MLTSSLARVTRKNMAWARPGLIIYLIARLATLVFVLIADLVDHQGLVAHLSVWDGKWFLRATQHGWPQHLPMVHGHVAANTTAFFPFFPFVLRVFSLGERLSPAVVGLVISALTGMVAVVCVGLLAKEIGTVEQARRATVLFALSPGSFVFSLIYSEGFLITFLALGLLALVRRRWWWAGIFGALATITSPVGLAFVVTCAVCSLVAIIKHRNWSSLVAPILAPLGFIGWMGYLWAHTGHFDAWRLTERGGWDSYPSLLYPVRIITQFLFNPLSPTLTGYMLLIGTIVSALGLWIVVKDRQPLALVAYATSALLLFAVAAPVGLRPRFIMQIFPMTIAVAARWSGWRYRALMATSVLLLIVMTFEEISSWAMFP